MIKGLGIDIADIDRIARAVENHDSPFAMRVYTAKERAEAELRKDFSSYYAGRWAVKEAVSKALGCGIGEDCSWQDIETLNQPGGQPHTLLHNRAAAAMRQLGGTVLHVTVSHSGGNALAMVIIEAL